MCVIAYKKKGVDAPSVEDIKDMFAVNPDGAGFAWSDGHVVHYEKGFMNVDDLLKRLMPLSQWKNKELAIHFRIGTAGKNDQATCHPFKISNNYGELRKTSGTGAVLFHNGIIDTGGIVNKDSSDTQDFVVGMYPMIKKYSNSKARDHIISEYTTGNRLLMMYGRHTKMFGSWTTIKGVMYSNTLWCGGGWSRWDNYYTHYTKDAWDCMKGKRFMEFGDTKKIDELIRDADDVGYGTLTKNGKIYMYDYEEMAVWEA